MESKKHEELKEQIKVLFDEKLELKSSLIESNRRLELYKTENEELKFSNKEKDYNYYLKESYIDGMKWVINAIVGNISDKEEN